MFIANDHHAMHIALAEARAAATRGEVPVGAVVMQDGQVIAQAGNAPVGTNDPCAHAELLAIRAAAQRLGNYRLDGCEVFVTLEPCAMCASAMLQARVRRVVFGAPEPKTGAAGSVLNLFGIPALNAHTTVQGGLLADESAALLSAFFAQRRAAHREDERRMQSRLRDDALRTPDAAFANLPDYPWPPIYTHDLPTLEGLRLHHVDVRPAEGWGSLPLADGAEEGLHGSATTQRVRGTWVCLHGQAGWSYQHRHLIAAAAAKGYRVLAPDLIGFGKSDKPKRATLDTTRPHSAPPPVGTLEWHAQVLSEWAARHGDAHMLWLAPVDDATVCALASAAAKRSGGAGLVWLPRSWRLSNQVTAQPDCVTTTPVDQAAFSAPYPHDSFRALQRALVASPQRMSVCASAGLPQHQPDSGLSPSAWVDDIGRFHACLRCR